MKNLIIFLALILAVSGQIFGQKKLSNETDEQKVKRMEWWTNARFGMFIHWGLYAMPARHEWVKNYESLTDADYQKYFDNFNPDLFDPREWAKMAKEAGMKYAVITTKHHEGFCMFDSQFTDYKVTNTPYHKDIIKEWVDAFRAEGLKIGFYYSLLDWHHPDYTYDTWHPQRPKDDKQFDAMNKNRDMNKYRQYLHNQVREILTKYGKVDIIWLDFTNPGQNGRGRTFEDWDAKKLLAMVRELQPGIMVNDRLGLKDYDDGFDFTTAEQVKLNSWPEVNGKRVPWETCQTFSGSWGYYRDEYTWKDTRQLLVLLIETVSKGGNLLLNVGPTGRGTFDERAQSSLGSMGKWMKVNSRSIYSCTQAPPEFKVPDNCLLTYNSKTNRLYIHLLEYPLNNLNLSGYKGKVKYAQFLHDASEIKITEPRQRRGQETDQNSINLSLPVRKPNVEIPVIELFLN